MKENVLYKANKWNKNIFLTGGEVNLPMNNNNWYQQNDPLKYKRVGNQQLAGLPSFWTNKIPSVNPDFKINPVEVKPKSSGMSSGLKAGLQAGAGALAGIAGQLGKSKDNPNGLYDIADPLHWLANGRKSDAGSALGSAGVGLFQTGVSSANPMLMLAGGITKGVGSLVDAAFGIKANQELLNAANTSIDTNKNFVSDASNYDDIKDIAGKTSTDVYEGGWFSGGKARRKNRELANKMNEAYSWADRSVENNIDNIRNNNMDILKANYAAFGGPLGFGMPSQGGAIDYGFMTDYLTTKDRQAANRSNMTNTFAGVPNSLFALGGDIQSNGADFTTGLTRVNAGGTHEENPYEGVQMGVDGEGVPNLVEEGETVWNEYVFSNRIEADEETKKKMHLPKKAAITFADISKKLEKEASERPNDPISKAALNAQMENLAEQQERQKAKEEARQAKEAFEALSPEEQKAVMQQVAMQQQAAQEQQIAAQQQAMQQPSPEEQAMMQEQAVQQGQPDVVEEQINPQDYNVNAYGGKINRFDNGGRKQRFYNLMGFHTDSDYDKWLDEEQLAEAEDAYNFDTIFTDPQNNSIVKAIAKRNPALAHSIGAGYDMGMYQPPANNPYNLAAFRTALGQYDKSKSKGNLDGNYTIDTEFGLGNYKTIQDLENSQAYKNYTNAMLGAIDRSKGARWKIREGADANNLTYDDIVFDGNNKFSKDDFDMLRTLRATANQTSTASKGLPVPMFIQGNDGWTSLGSDAHEMYDRLRNDHKGGVFHMSPDLLKRDAQVKNWVQDDNGNWEEIVGDVPTDWSKTNTYQWNDPTTGYTYNYYKRPGTGDAEASTDDNGDIVPNHRNENLRYAGILGPAVGLGLQMAGVGRPDTALLDSAVSAYDRTEPGHADYETIGDYLKYRPMDIWFEQNRLNANSRATGRQIANNGTPVGTKVAGLLANDYNNQIASGDLYRKALEYNDAQRKMVGEFNKDTNKFNAEAYNRAALTNAELRARDRQYKANLAMEAAKEKMAADAGWYNSIYGNIGGLFKGIADMGKENAQWNMISDMWADGLAGTATPKTHSSRGHLKYADDDKKKSKKGGK